MSRMIGKEMVEAELKAEMYLGRMNEIQAREEFDMEWYRDFYDPQGIHVSKRDRACKEFYINALLYKKYSDLQESLALEIRRLKCYHGK